MQEKQILAVVVDPIEKGGNNEIARDAVPEGMPVVSNLRMWTCAGW